MNKTVLPPNHLENGVLVGLDGYLFLARGAHNTLHVMDNVRGVSRENSDTFRGNLAARKEWCHKNNAVFCHVIFPDKQSIIPEKWPRDKLIKLGKLYLAEADVLQENIIYPDEILHCHWIRAVRKVDTHLNVFGTLLVAAKVVEQLTGELQHEMLEAISQNPIRVTVDAGDLGSKLTPEVTENLCRMEVRNKGMSFRNRLTGGNNGIVDLHFSSSAPNKKRCLVMGDSFGRELAKYMNLWFSEVHFFRSQFFHPDIADLIRPDFLVTENVERYMHTIHSDEIRPFFFAYPRLVGASYQPSDGFAGALSAVMSFNREPYLKFMASLVVER